MKGLAQIVLVVRVPATLLIWCMSVQMFLMRERVSSKCKVNIEVAVIEWKAFARRVDNVDALIRLDVHGYKFAPESLKVTSRRALYSSTADV